VYSSELNYIVLSIDFCPVSPLICLKYTTLPLSFLYMLY